MQVSNKATYPSRRAWWGMPWWGLAVLFYVSNKATYPSRRAIVYKQLLPLGIQSFQQGDLSQSAGELQLSWLEWLVVGTASHVSNKATYPSRRATYMALTQVVGLVLVSNKATYPSRRA